MDDEKQWMTIKDVADETFTGESTVRRWLRDGVLKGYKLGRDWKIKPIHFEEFMQSRANFSN